MPPYSDSAAQPFTALDRAQADVAAVRDDPLGRLTLMRGLYEHPAIGSGRVPYRRAALAFMDWELRRGLLDPLSGDSPGSPWWRATNEDLLRISAEADYLVAECGGPASSRPVELAVEFLRRPSRRSWYAAHNSAVLSSYLQQRHLAEAEGRVERFFLNLVLMRVMFAHALVAAPRLALGWGAPFGPLLGDPRLGMTGIFLSLSRVLPDRYPLGETVTPYAADEQGFGRMLDVGVIGPRLRQLYDWSAETLGIPEVTDLLIDGIPAYAWDPGESKDWYPSPGVAARLARRLIPVSS